MLVRSRKTCRPSLLRSPLLRCDGQSGGAAKRFSGAPAYSLSLRRGVLQSYPVSTRIADGMACRTPDPFALDWIRRGVERCGTE